jgi:multidrug resistance efflux pump
MYKGKPIFIPILVVLGLVAYGGWYLLRERDAQNGSLEASGTIEAVEVSVSAEVSGRAAEVLVAEGDLVEKGAPLLRLEDELLQAQGQKALAGLQAARGAQKTAEEALGVAQAGLELAQAQLDSAQASLDLARLQYQRTLNAARQAELPARLEAWRLSQPSEFDLPVWYFHKEESLSGARASLEAASATLEAERSALDNLVNEIGGEELVSAEKRLAEAEQTFWIAKQVLEQARLATQGNDMEAFAQQLYDKAEAALNLAQDDYDSLLSNQQRSEIMEQRARLAVAQEQYEAALDRLNRLQTGDQSLEVQIADASRVQAETNLTQAQAGVKRAEAAVAQSQASLAQTEALVAQAQAEVDLIGLQRERYTVFAPLSGVVLVRNLEPGEIAQAGATVLIIGQLDQLSLTIYLPEDRYGEVKLGDTAEVRVDSFPGRTFTATVTRIADQAEFTPRNVQTQEGRKTTFFAVELSMDNRDGALKPGMPADVVFP